MSFSLIIWYEAEPPDPTRAMDVYQRLSDGETGVAEVSRAVEDFFAEVISVYGDLTIDNLDAPWMVELDHTSECVIFQISWSRSKEVVKRLVQMADKYGLTAFDPQTEDIYDPGPRT